MIDRESYLELLEDELFWMTYLAKQLERGDKHLCDWAIDGVVTIRLKEVEA